MGADNDLVYSGHHCEDSRICDEVCLDSGLCQFFCGFMPAECWCGFCNDNFKLADLVSLLKEAYQSVAETVGEDEVVVADVLLGLLRD